MQGIVIGNGRKVKKKVSESVKFVKTPEYNILRNIML